MISPELSFRSPPAPCNVHLPFPFSMSLRCAPLFTVRPAPLDMKRNGG